MLVKPAQNVIVELTFRQTPPKDPNAKAESKAVQRSIYAGWTGMQSKRRLAPVVARDGVSNRSALGVREREVSLVEIDTSFAKTLGLVEGQQVCSSTPQ